MEEVLYMILIAAAIVCLLIFSSIAFEFLIEVPKQLKRIADALEKEKSNEGNSCN